MLDLEATIFKKAIVIQQQHLRVSTEMFLIMMHQVLTSISNHKNRYNTSIKFPTKEYSFGRASRRLKT